MPWHSEEVGFFGFEEGGGGGGGGGGVHKFEVISCMLLPSLEFKKCAEKVWRQWKGDQWAISGKEKETGLS